MLQLLKKKSSKNPMEESLKDKVKEKEDALHKTIEEEELLLLKMKKKKEKFKKATNTFLFLLKKTTKCKTNFNLFMVLALV